MEGAPGNKTAGAGRLLAHGWRGGLAVALIGGLVWGLMQYFTPVMIDDLAFMAQYLACNDGDSGFSMEALRDFALYNRAHDNFRIANMLAPFSTLFNPWKELFPMFTGLAGAAMIWLAARLACGRCPGWRFQAVVWLLITLFLPMRAGMFVRDFSLNYIYASALALCAVWLVIRYETAGWKWSAFIIAAIVVFISGGWHEGPGAALVSGMLFYAGACCIARKKVSWQWWVTTIIYGLSVVVFLFCPGMLDRAGREVGTEGQTPVIYRIYDLSMVLMLLLLAAGALWVRKLRACFYEAVGNPAFVVFSVSAVVGAVLATFIIPNQRASLWPQLSAIIALSILLRPLCPRISQNTLSRIGSLAVLLCVLHGVVSLVWQWRFYSENERVMAEYDVSSTGTVFENVTMPEDVPLLTLSYPSKLLWLNWLHYHQFRYFNPDKPLSVVPEALRTASARNSAPASSDSTVYRAEGCFFAPLKRYKLIEYSGASAQFVLSDGKVTGADLFTLPYINSQGDTLVYIRPFGVDCDRIKRVEYFTVYPDNDPFRGDPRLFRQRVRNEVKPH